ncbi:hypothetical protein LTR85_009468 [Meristemomyces frigidus]|nr:hypothetical protein LTR85_009468 [Meristemomyces frigidus]
MACDVAGSPYPESFLDSWGSKNPETTDLDALVDFNAAFGENENNNTIDPQMLSNRSSPASSYNNAFNASGMDDTLSPEPTGLGAYPTDFANPQTSATPYFHPSLELHSAVPFQPSGLRYQTRQRSISEPPDAFAQDRHLPNGPADITFHRGGHWLGPQHQQAPKSLKSLPKGKGHQQMRSQPYKNKPTRMADHRQQQQRYQLRRTQTQPMRPPMSVPAMPPPHPMAHVQMQHHGQQVFEPPPPMMDGQRYVTSRVCTPVPEMPPPVMMQSPQQQIDPLLMTPPPVAAVAGGNADGKQTVTVPLTVEELRAMIMDAVQKAVKGVESGNADVAVGIVEEPTKEELDEETAVEEVVEQ